MGLEERSTHLEQSSVHGLHLRVTKKDSPALKKLSVAASNSVHILSTLKAGVLFRTPTLEALAKVHATSLISWTLPSSLPQLNSTQPPFTELQRHPRPV